MKKTALALAFLLTLCSFAGCTETKKESVIVIDDDLFINAEQDEESPESGDIPEETEEKETEKATEETTSATESVKGTVRDNIYTNEFLELKYKAPFSWKLVSGKVAKAFSAFTSHILGIEDADAGESSGESAVYVDMIGYSEYSEVSYVSVRIIDCSELVPQYADIAIDDLLALTALTGTNCSEIETVKIAGKEYRKISYNTSTADGYPAISADYARKEGEFLCLISITDESAEMISAREKCFTVPN